MKSIKYKLIIGAFAIAGLSSCNKEFLNDKPTTSVLLTDAIQSESDLQVATAGIYSALRAVDLYGRTLPVKGDLMGDNTFVITSNSGRYTTLNAYIFTANDSYALGIWQNAYLTIKYANTVIAAAATLPTSANVKQYLGEAYAIRALMHFELVRNFAPAYTLDNTKLGIPLVLKYDQNVLPQRNKISEVYTQVIADLESAYSLLSVYRGTAYFSKYSARALEARVYQSMGDWANAKTTALDVINNGGFTLTPSASYVSYWNNPSVQASGKVETLFEVASDVANNNAFDQIGYIYQQIAGNGYGDILATADLAGLYATTDVRKSLISTGTRSGQSGTAYFCLKYPNPSNTTDKDDTKVLRLSDILLIAAEAYYNANDFVNANIYLNKVAQQRDPSFLGYANTGAQVLEDILTERRKELAFEGSRFWDLVRLKRTFTKISNQSPLTTISVAPGNIALVFPIPQAEINANPNITQNTGY